VYVLLKEEHISYTMGISAFPDIYALALGHVALGKVRIYQAKHSCPWYNYYINKNDTTRLYCMPFYVCVFHTV